MSVPINYNISDKEYEKISKYKDLDIEIIWHLKTITESLTVGALSVIKKGTDKHTNNVPHSPGRYEIQNKMHFAELLISLGCPVGWGCRIHRRLLLYRGVRPPPNECPDMTLNNLMVRFQ